jgi:hypothetical protein
VRSQLPNRRLKRNFPAQPRDLDFKARVVPEIQRWQDVPPPNGMSVSTEINVHAASIPTLTLFRPRRMRRLLLEHSMQRCQRRHVHLENLAAYVEGSSGRNGMRLNVQIVFYVF